MSSYISAKGEWWSDPRLALGIIGSLYLGCVPALELLGLPTIVSSTNNIAAAFVLHNIGWSASILLFPIYRPLSTLRESIGNKHEKLSNNIINPILFTAGIAAAILMLFYVRGGFDGSFLMRDGRYENLYSQDRLILSMTFVGSVVFIFSKWKGMRLSLKVVTLAIIAGYCGMMLSMGNRREVVQLFMPMSYILACNAKRPKLLVASLLLIALTGLTIVGWYRIGVSASDNNLGSLASNIEFAIPAITLDFYTQSTEEHKLGATIIQSPLMLLPRYIFPWKPDDLGTKFIKDYPYSQEGMGYAFLPSTELYINFGYIGILLGTMVLGFLLHRLYTTNTSPRRSFFILITLCYAFDFNRGTFATIFYQIFISMIGFYICHFLHHSNKRVGSVG